MHEVQFINFKMKNYVYVILAVVSIGCSSKKKVVYFQDIDKNTMSAIDSVITQPQIDVNDILEINISAMDVQSLEPFIVKSSKAESGQVFLVNREGNIQFPVLGTIFVKNKSVPELQELISDSLTNYIVNPVVQIRITNFKITVLGAVNSPGTYQIAEEGMTMLQAVGLSGDFAIFGKRDNVLLIRQENGLRTNYRIDFTKTDWFNTELYYLKQNDVLYVEPNFAQVKSAGLIKDINELLRIIATTIPIYVLLTTR